MTRNVQSPGPTNPGAMRASRCGRLPAEARVLGPILRLSRSEIVEIQLVTQYFHRVFLHLHPA